MVRKSDLSSFEHGCVGALVGSIEQSIMRPTVYWKAELQQDRFCMRRAINPRFCYRGLPVAVTSIAPVTCVQFATNNICVNALKRIRGASKHTAPKDSDTMISGIVAGATSSLAQAPFQLVEINQQRAGGNMVATAKRIVDARGMLGLYRGLSVTAVREGIFCCGYIAIAPALKRTILEKRPETSESTALAASAVISGTFAGVLSHPADTLKTRLQGSIFDEVRPSGPVEALQQLRDSGPGSLVKKCYKGVAPRTFRLCCCTFIYSTLTDLVEDLAMRTHGEGPRWQLFFGKHMPRSTGIEAEAGGQMASAGLPAC